MTVVKKTFTSDKFTVIYMVDEVHHGMRLDQYMQIHLATFSRQQVKKKISDGEVVIKGRPGKHRPSTVVHHKDHITMVTIKSEHEDEYWRGEKLELQLVPEIIYEDKNCAIISKPPYMATHPTGKHLFNCATVYFESQTGTTVHSIHRLDRETSGVLLLGKNPKTANELTEEFEKDNVKKCYFFIARVKDEFAGNDDFEANERLGTNEKGLKRVFINNFPADSSEGKHARTFFKVLYKQDGYALGLAFPQTGRQHQIRVHAMVHGLPLIGDKIYYGSFKMFQRFKDVIATEEDHDLMELSRHALHAVALKIPYQGEPCIYKAPLPHDLKGWIQDKMSIEISELENLIKEKVEAYFIASDK